jgi:hypothetical protein
MKALREAGYDDFVLIHSGNPKPCTCSSDTCDDRDCAPFTISWRETQELHLLSSEARLKALPLPPHFPAAINLLLARACSFPLSVFDHLHELTPAKYGYSSSLDVLVVPSSQPTPQL